MKIRLESDFEDYYDGVFIRNSDLQTDVVFRRMATASTTRREDFQLLKQHGYQTPLNGPVLDVASQIKARYRELPLASKSHLVVYTDEKAHRGEGKILVPLDEAVAQYPTHYASEFLNCAELGFAPVISSYRMLRIGRKEYWLEYQSKGWRSNFEAEIISLGSPLSLSFPIIPNYPMYAVDFVNTAGIGLVAVDFNPAPGIGGCELMKTLLPLDILKQLESWYEALEKA